jgi:hypothetical protein
MTSHRASQLTILASDRFAPGAVVPWKSAFGPIADRSESAAARLGIHA